MGPHSKPNALRAGVAHADGHARAARPEAALGLSEPRARGVVPVHQAHHRSAGEAAGADRRLDRALVGASETLDGVELGELAIEAARLRGPTGGPSLREPTVHLVGARGHEVGERTRARHRWVSLDV